MNLSETARLLSMISAFNNRTIGEGDVNAWQSVLDDVPFGDAQEAVRRHFAESTDWMMPAHVRHIVRDIVRGRAKAARQWAPGQHGVSKDAALPEIERGKRLTADDVSPDVLELLSQLRAVLPDTGREVLHPRRVAWEREQRAFQRADGGDPNPHYRPRTAQTPADQAAGYPESYPAGSYADPDRRREICRANGPHDSGLHTDGCPDA